jgi:hypothetical protein
MQTHPAQMCNRFESKMSDFDLDIPFTVVCSPLSSHSMVSVAHLRSAIYISLSESTPAEVYRSLSAMHHAPRPDMIAERHFTVLGTNVRAMKDLRHSMISLGYSVISTMSKKVAENVGSVTEDEDVDSLISKPGPIGS